MGTDPYTHTHTHTHWVDKFLNILFSSFLVIMKLEVVCLDPHQDIFGGIPITKSLIFRLILYCGEFQTHSELKE